MQDRILRRIFLLAGIVLLVWVLYLLKPVVIPFIGAFFLAYLFSPLVEVLVKIKIPRWLAISIVFIGIGVTLTVALWYLVPLIWKQLCLRSRPVFQRGSIGLMQSYYRGFLRHSMSSKWKLIPIKCPKL